MKKKVSLFALRSEVAKYENLRAAAIRWVLRKTGGPRRAQTLKLGSERLRVQIRLPFLVEEGSTEVSDFPPFVSPLGELVSIHTS